MVFVSGKLFYPQLLPAQRTGMIPLMLAAMASHNSVRTLLL